ncbi:MAG: virulence-associated E family protein [Pseudomonadota bacterium]
MTETSRFTDATGFMQSQHPDANWVVTAIPVGEGPTETRTFGHGSGRLGTGRHIQDFQEWIDVRQPSHNIYWHPNPANRDLMKKAAIKDIEAVVRLQVDVDPEPGADLKQEQERILGLFTHNLPKGVPEPTTLVFSGGGYQAFWEMEEAIRISGNEAKAHEAGLYNKRLAEIFEGDNCHAVCQLFRVPFTLNVAGEAKRKKGRTNTQSRVMWHKPKNIYPLSKFKKSKDVNEAVRDALDASQIITPTIEEIIALGGSSDLPAAITYKPEYLHDREEPPIDLTRWPSRSERVHFVACELVRIGLKPDGKIVGALLNEDWAVSDSMYTFANGKRRAKPIEYAMRQVEKAKAKVRQEKEKEAATNTDVQGTLKFKCDNEGKPYKTLFHNYRVALQQLGVTVKKDIFNRCYIIEGLDADFDGRLTDEAVARLRIRIEDRFGFKIKKDDMRDLIGDIGEDHRFHPVCDYLNGLKWDGTKRLETWPSLYLGAASNAYTQAIGPKSLIACVRRARKPGCKSDEMMVLEGSQGGGKSTALKLLAVKPEWFADEVPIGGNGKEIIEATEGKWIVEAQELAGLSKRDAENVKSMLSRTFDKGRKSYGRFSDQHDRQCKFFGSTNGGQANKYLNDPTGARRFWPVECGKIDLEGLKRDRDQLWAEAAHREAQGESIQLDPSLYHLATGEQFKRQQENPMEEVFNAKFGGFKGRFPIGEIYDLLGVQKTQASMVAIGQAATALGWERKKLTYNGPRVMCYVRGNPTERETLLAPERRVEGVWQVVEKRPEKKRPEGTEDDAEDQVEIPF